MVHRHPREAGTPDDCVISRADAGVTFFACTHL